MRKLFVGILAIAVGTSGCSSKVSHPILHEDVSSVSGGPASSKVKFNRHILVDQFGYRPGDPKVAVIRDPQSGYDANDHFVAGVRYQVRHAADGSLVFEGLTKPWNKGVVESSSGDRGWWFDFSSVSAAGAYFVFDPTNQARSATFKIDQLVYSDILVAATRMFYYQRSSFAKQLPFAESCWLDAPAYLGPNQDTAARDITDVKNLDKVKDLSGGWFDAGDTNKYVTNAAPVVHQLLTAFEQNKAAFAKTSRIPESGNGVPDVLNEVKWETDWLKKTQYSDGSALLKVGAIVWAKASPPSLDKSERFYVPSCTASTIAIAGIFAHASYVYLGVPDLLSDAADLKNRAAKAWNNYIGIKTKQIHCDSGVVHAGPADQNVETQDSEAVVAAVYLFAITGDFVYNDYIKAHYRQLRPYRDIGWSRYDPEQGEALLFYARLSFADSGLKKTITNDKRRDMQVNNQIYGFSESDDLYRNFLHDPQYHWGSNQVRANYGNSNMDAIAYSDLAQDAVGYRTRALDTLHYFHGVNPFAKVYLTNMYEYGATSSVNEIFHAWYRADSKHWYGHKSKWSDAITSECGPAPGYVPGGPVANATWAGISDSLVPPAGQPPQKSYRDWNHDGWEKSWIINEPGIYYQSAYLKLLANFAY